MVGQNVESIRGEFAFAISDALRNVDRAQRGMDSLAGRLDKVERESRDTGQAVNKTGLILDQFGRAATTTSTKVNTLSNSLDRAGREADQAGRKGRRAGQDIDRLGGASKRASQGMFRFGLGVQEFTVLAAGYATIRLGAKVLSDASAIESGFVGVRKTTGLTGSAFEELRQKTLELSGELRGVPTSGIQEIAAIAGQLGIRGTENIVNFTETVAKASLAMDMGSESTAIYLARLSNLFKVPIDQLDQLGSSINELSNTTTATGSEIFDITTRFGQMANVMGLTAQQSAALAATLRDAGVNVEVAGTQMQQILGKMLSNTREFANIANVDFKEFSDLIRKDPIKAIEALAKGISNLSNDDVQQAVIGFTELGLEGQRATQILLGLANSTDILRKNIDTSNQAFDEGTSLQREYEAASTTLSAAITRLWNNFGLLSTSILNDALPSMSKFINTLSDGIAIVSGFGRSVEDLIDNVIDERNVVSKLKDELKELTSEQNRSKESQDRINAIVEQLIEIIPTLSVKYDGLGNAISLATGQLDEFIKKNEELAKNATKARILEISTTVEGRNEAIEQVRKEIDSNQAAMDEGEFYFDRGGAKNISRKAEAKRLQDHLKTLLDERNDLKDEFFSLQELLDSQNGKPPKGDAPADKAETKKDPTNIEVTDTGTGSSDTEKTRIQIENENALLALQDELKRKLLQIEQNRAALVKENPSLEALINQNAELQRQEVLRNHQAEVERKFGAEQKQRASELFALKKEELSIQSELLNLEKSDSEQTREFKLLEVDKQGDPENVEMAQVQADQILAIEKEYTAQQQAIRDQQYQIELALLNQELEAKQQQARDEIDNEVLLNERLGQINEIYHQEELALAQKLAHDKEEIDFNYQKTRAAIEQRITDINRRESERRISEARQEARARQDAFRNILDPLVSGGDMRDVFKRLMQEELVTRLSRGLAGAPAENENRTIMEVLFSQKQQNVNEKIAENTQATADAAKETNKGLSNLPINMGNVLGAVLGASLTDGKVSGKNIGMIFASSLIGGLIDYGVGGGFSGGGMNTGSANTAQGTQALPNHNVPIPGQDIGGFSLAGPSTEIIRDRKQVFNNTTKLQPFSLDLSPLNKSIENSFSQLMARSLNESKTINENQSLVKNETIDNRSIENKTINENSNLTKSETFNTTENKTINETPSLFSGYKMEPVEIDLTPFKESIDASFERATDLIEQGLMAYQERQEAVNNITNQAYNAYENHQSNVKNSNSIKQEITIDNRGGKFDQSTIPELKKMMEGVAVKTMVAQERRNGQAAQARKRYGQ